MTSKLTKNYLDLSSHQIFYIFKYNIKLVVKHSIYTQTYLQNLLLIPSLVRLPNTDIQ